MKKLLFILIVVLFASCEKEDAYKELTFNYCVETVTDLKGNVISVNEYSDNFTFIIDGDNILNDLDEMPRPLKNIKNLSASYHISNSEYIDVKSSANKINSTFRFYNLLTAELK